MAISFQLSTRFASPEESEVVAAEGSQQNRVHRCDRGIALDWLASDLGLASDGSCLPQSAAGLGVHVGSFVRHLSQPEMADSGGERDHELLVHHGAR
jgi:hypothetical protein